MTRLFLIIYIGLHAAVLNAQTSPRDCEAEAELALSELELSGFDKVVDSIERSDNVIFNGLSEVLDILIDTPNVERTRIARRKRYCLENETARRREDEDYARGQRDIAMSLRIARQAKEAQNQNAEPHGPVIGPVMTNNTDQTPVDLETDTNSLTDLESFARKLANPKTIENNALRPRQQR